jgi:hypothetical protein
MPRRFGPFLVAAVVAGCVAPVAAAQPPAIRTANPAKRGLTDSAFPRTIQVADNVYTYEDFHAGPEKVTTTNLFVVTDQGVLVADGHRSAAETEGCVHPASNAMRDRSADAAAKVGWAGAWRLPADAMLVSNRHSLKLGAERIDILFLSGIFLNRVFPAMRSAHPSEWRTTLDRADLMKPDISIPGHGFTETGPVSREEGVRHLSQGARGRHHRGGETAACRRAGRPGRQTGERRESASWTPASSQGSIAIRKVEEALNG